MPDAAASIAGERRWRIVADPLCDAHPERVDEGWPADCQFDLADLEAPAELVVVLDRPWPVLLDLLAAAGLAWFARPVQQVIERTVRESLVESLGEVVFARAMRLPLPAVPDGASAADWRPLATGRFDVLVSAGAGLCADAMRHFGPAWRHCLSTRLPPGLGSADTSFDWLSARPSSISRASALRRLSWLAYELEPLQAPNRS